MALPPRHVLFVCGKARMRSPTAAEIAPRLLGVTADLGGLSADADVVLDRDQLAAADIIAVMERAQLARLKRQFGPELRGKRLVCLDVPDRFSFMAPDLIALLTRQFARLA
jgi:predicted protein tyrosine phosphatase